MTVVETLDMEMTIRDYLSADTVAPLFVQGDALHVLEKMPADSIDMCMTSPPYWNKRQYSNSGIGLETTYAEYIDNLLKVFAEVKRVLKPSGSFWLNIGDTYLDKGLAGIPWRVILALTDEFGWVLRNSIIWNKLKGGLDNTSDRLGNVHEHLFHLVKESKGYYYDADAIRSKPRKSKVVNGAIVSATGVTGVRYRRQVELSTSLSDDEKASALLALDSMLKQMEKGEVADFRMVIRNQQRTTHSNSVKISGRAKELRDKGFYFLKYHPKGSKPTDVWDILPEDTHKRKEHYAAYPEDLCKIPILATCPVGGTVIDPFCGTGTTMAVAQQLGRSSIGIDLSREYLEIGEQRCRRLL